MGADGSRARELVHDGAVGEESDLRLWHCKLRVGADESPRGMPREAEAATHGDARHVCGDCCRGRGQDHVDGVLELEELEPGSTVDHRLPELPDIGAAAKTALAVTTQLDSGDGLGMQPSAQGLVDGFQHLKVQRVDGSRAVQREVTHPVDDFAANQFRHGPEVYRH